MGICTAILAHVDAGKTTLAESLLYLSGSIRQLGRVDNKDTFLDNNDIERERGITVFSKQAQVTFGDKNVTLLDTPGHVDFSAEMERTLHISDYAILVISGSDGVQSHVVTLWKLLKVYNIPVFLFINKMDQPDNDAAAIMEELKLRLSAECIDFTQAGTEEFYDSVATCSEAALEEFLETDEVSEQTIADMIKKREVFPCFFGSALKLTGVEEFINGFAKYAKEPRYIEDFGAKVYKITRDNQGNRLTHIKVTGGSIVPKMVIDDEKINQIRIYSGASFESVNEAHAGQICAITGLDKTFCGQGLGDNKETSLPVLEPVMVYKVILPDACNVNDMYLKFKQLEEEEPELQIAWNEQNSEINVKLMGEIQTEVLKRMIRERYDVDVSFSSGSIVYKETIARKTEGVGHYEPLRHYAEVHITVEPAERGSGVTIDTDCSEDLLAKNWQRLIVTNLSERSHVGILTGGELTDVKITVVGGRAHLKHTEGGDFRQASYRAVRHALMKAGCVLLEPVYNYRIEVPLEYTGRVMTDIQKMHGTFEIEENDGAAGGNTAGGGTAEVFTVIVGKCPVATMQGYQSELMAYSKGNGRLFCSLSGYEECHNTEEVIEKSQYDVEADIANPAGSIFCSHGAGYYVSWEQVEEYMHIPLTFKDDEGGVNGYGGGYGDVSDKHGEAQGYMANGMRTPDGYMPKAYYAKKSGGSYYKEPETYQAASLHGLADKELEDIFVKTYGEIKHKKEAPVAKVVDYNKPLDPRSHAAKNAAKNASKENYLLVDGYNIIHAWPQLKTLAAENLESARIKLLDILCNYQGYKKMTLIVVFDAYKVKGKQREVTEYNNIYVVYTKEAETADQYIEKTVHKIGQKNNVTVATSDALEQIIIFGQGAIRMSASGLLNDVKAVEEEIRGML